MKIFERLEQICCYLFDTSLVWRFWVIGSTILRNSLSQVSSGCHNETVTTSIATVTLHCLRPMSIFRSFKLQTHKSILQNQPLGGSINRCIILASNDQLRHESFCNHSVQCLTNRIASSAAYTKLNFINLYSRTTNLHSCFCHPNPIASGCRCMLHYCIMLGCAIDGHRLIQRFKARRPSRI